MKGFRFLERWKPLNSSELSKVYGARAGGTGDIDDVALQVRTRTCALQLVAEGKERFKFIEPGDRLKVS